MDKLERTRLMYVWSDMKRRCHREKHHAYHNYGGRGITVCDRWRNSFSDFLADMGPRPDRSMTLERKNNDAGYSPENCIWATRLAQSLNKRDYANNTSGNRNIAQETRVIRGYNYTCWRVRIRRAGLIVASRRFKSIDDAIQYRNMAEKEYQNGGA
jgi:hypothetical protein